MALSLADIPRLSTRLRRRRRPLGTLTSVTELIVEAELTGTRDGITQLQRRWRQRSPESSADQPLPPRSAIVVVHGLGEHSGRYDHVGRYLADQGHDVLAFDNRGFGQSGGRRGHVDSFEHFLDDVEDLVIERRQLGAPVVLLGHSLGGLIATSYVVSGRPEPDLLVLSSPALGADVPAWQRVAAPVLSRVSPRLFVKGDIDGAILSHDRDVQVSYRDDPLRVAGSTARLGQEIFRAMEETSSGIGQVTMPCYVLHGAADELVPPNYSRPLSRLSNVTYRLWPGLRHECFNELEKEAVLGALGEWLDESLTELKSA